MDYKTHNKKILIITIVFILTSVSIYCCPKETVANKSVSLNQHFNCIGDWGSRDLTINSEIKDALGLDDVLFSEFSKSSETVTLYIGYYYTTKKIGAAHSPLVCFPGQGWVVSSKEERTLRIKGTNLRAMTMLVTKGQEKELVIYWFQAFDKAFPGTFAQKLYALWAKVLNSREDNAFVRVTVPIGDQTVEEAFATGLGFVESFYPAFLDFVKAET